MAVTDISNPILNSPYCPPEAYFELGAHGPTGVVLTGRRPSESFIPIPAGQKRGAEQQAFDFDPTGERREQNSLINDIRREVERWRAGNWNGVTPYSRKLLAHWAAGPPTRDEPVFFCQREAAEMRWMSQRWFIGPRFRMCGRPCRDWIRSPGSGPGVRGHCRWRSTLHLLTPPLGRSLSRVRR